jgi:hypothetical protein
VRVDPGDLVGKRSEAETKIDIYIRFNALLMLHNIPSICISGPDQKPFPLWDGIRGVGSRINHQARLAGDGSP